MAAKVQVYRSTIDNEMPNCFHQDLIHSSNNVYNTALGRVEIKFKILLHFKVVFDFPKNTSNFGLFSNIKWRLILLIFD